MTDLTWLRVYATLGEVLIDSDPYDAKGAFLLLHSIDAELTKTMIKDSYVAARCNLIASFEAKEKNLEAARHSMTKVVAELERLRESMVERRTPGESR